MIHTHRSCTSLQVLWVLLGRPLMLKSVANQALLCTLLAWLGPSELSSPWSPLRNQGPQRSPYASHPGQSPRGNPLVGSSAGLTHGTQNSCPMNPGATSCPSQRPAGHHTEVAILNKLQPSQSLWRRKWQPAPVFFPGKFCGQKTLVGHSSWGHKESDIAGHTHTSWSLSDSLRGIPIGRQLPMPKRS